MWSEVGTRRYSYRMRTDGPWIGYSVTADVVDGRVRTIHDYVEEGRGGHGHPTFFRLGQPEVDAGSDHHVLWLRHANIKIY